MKVSWEFKLSFFLFSFFGRGLGEGVVIVLEIFSCSLSLYYL